MLATTKHALDHRLATEQHDKRAPSLVAAVLRDGVPVWSGGRGRVAGARPTENTQYRIGSITKSFVAVLIMKLRDEGLLRLDDPLGTHVPGTALGDVTIGDLLAHRAGITAEPAGSWWERSAGRDWTELAGSTGPATLRTRAGRRHHYSNLGFAALGEVVHRLRGHDWHTAVHDEILLPLGMPRTTPMPAAPHATGWAVHPWADVLLPEPAHDSKAMAPAGQLWSTVTDLCQWAAFLGGDTGDVLAADSLAEMREPVGLDDLEDADEWDAAYGLGLQLLRNRGRRLVGHTGSMPGFLATVWTHTDDGSAGVALANTTAGLPVGTLVADLIDVLATHEPKEPAEWVPMTDVDQDVLALTGQWYWGPTGFGLRLLAGNHLELLPLRSDRPRLRFRPEPDGTWTGMDGYFAAETLRVVRRPDGSVSHLDLNTFVLTRTPYDPEASIPGGLDEGGWG